MLGDARRVGSDRTLYQGCLSAEFPTLHAARATGHEPYLTPFVVSLSNHTQRPFDKLRANGPAAVRAGLG